MGLVLPFFVSITSSHVAAVEVCVAVLKVIHVTQRERD